MTDDYNLIARHYDACYKAKSNLTDLPFYVDLAEQHGGPVLEIACGTGRVLLEIAKKGINIIGIDNSEAQMDILRAKLNQEASSVQQLVQIEYGDMRSFQLNRKFPLVIMPFRPMQHMYTIDDQIAALQSAKNHLSENGKLVLDVFFPRFDILYENMNNEIPEMEWPDPENPELTVKRFFVKTHIDKLKQNFSGHFIFRTYHNSGLVKEETSPISMSYYTYPHLLLLFRIAGLKIVEEYGSFEKDPITIGKEMIFVVERG